MSEPMTALSDRLDRIEEECRRLDRVARGWRRLALACVAGIVLVLGVGARHSTVEKVVEAEQFILRDQDGKVRAKLAAGQKGTAGLYLLDVDGKTRIFAGTVAGWQATIAMHDTQSRDRMNLTVHPDGTPMLKMNDAKQKSGLDLSVIPPGSPFFQMHDAESVGRIAIGVDENTGPGLFVKDKKGNSRASLQTVGADKAVVLVFTDGAKKIVQTIPTFDQLAPK